MRTSITSQIHLEYRKTGFHWRRRLPQALRAWGEPPSNKKMSLIFPLRSHVIPEAKALALKLTLLSEIAFAGLTERTMAIAPHTMESILTELCRFIIDAAEAAREIAPCRTPEIAAYELACVNAAIDTLRHAIAMRDRQSARGPLQEVAHRLGLILDENDPDWQRLAFRALRVMVEAQEEILSREQGIYGGSTQCRSLPDQPMMQLQRTVKVPAPRPSPLTNPSEYAHQPAVDVTLYERAAPLQTQTCAPIAKGASPAEPDPTPQMPQNAKKGRKINAIAEHYVDLRSKGHSTFKANETLSKDAGKSWEKNSSGNVYSTGRLMALALNDIPLDQVSDSELTAAFNLLQRVPRNYQAATSKLSPQQAADEADTQEQHNAQLTRARMESQGASPGKIEVTILRERIRRLSPNTIYRHMQDFQRICRFAVIQGDLAENIMAEHIWKKTDVDQRTLEAEDTERQTWVGRLDKLFRTPIFQDKLDDIGDPLFWAPLIAVHMGFRSEEILQLNLADIETIGDVPCICLKQGPGQNLKSRAARRIVPIHQNLIDIGFLALVVKRKRDGEERLFPWLQRSASKETFTENFSKKFTRYRKDVECYDPQRDFHSFRTTFNHLLIESRCFDSHRRYIMGHVDRDVGITNYNPDGFSKALLLDDVNAVEIDISMIRSPFENAKPSSVTHLADHRLAMPS
ncbi:site-specific integrase [Sulfitobacter sp. TCYB15]|uniref:Site-specific integrase n=1 Tax=Sulfitobacter sp. TCYB15 TaxID=3229275 RepID=A0AAU8BZC8_9RHOB